MSVNTPLRAAVIGGSGFGRYHAQWYAREGAEVVGYACTTPESVSAAREAIEKLTGQSPRGYTDVQTLIQQESPDVLSVCTPPANHAGPTESALNAGIHVFCEKPLLYNARLSHEEMLAIADRLVQTAMNAGKVLAVNLQYAAVLDSYFELYRQDWGAMTGITSFEFSMQSKGNRRGPNVYEQSWVELGPHALAPLLHQLPNAQLELDTVRSTVAETEVSVEMEVVNPDGSRIPVRIRTGVCGKEDTPLRRFGFNGYLVDLINDKDEAGVPRTILRSVENDQSLLTEDLMRVGIRRFLAAARGEAAPLVSGAQARRNLDVHLAILAQLRR